MNTDITYKEAIRKHRALKEIGQTRIYLMDESGERPWAHVSKVEPGGSHRLDIATSVNFTATDPATKLEFSWSFDIEPRSANGKGSYEIDAAACREVTRMLFGKPREAFIKYLADCARKVQERGHEYQETADRQFRDAAILMKLAQESD